MEPELGSADFVGKIEKHECVLTNKWKLRLLLHTKIIEPTFLSDGPWTLC